MPRPQFTSFLPARINTGPWVAGYSLDVLKTRLPQERCVLPICSLGTPPEELAGLAPLVLPPIYHEALDDNLQAAMVAQIRRCFPFYAESRAGRSGGRAIEVVELPRRTPAAPAERPRVLAFGVDTTVEQHGPHLPLATDTIQTYAVLERLAAEFDGFMIGPPLDYGHLTWGLAFGMSVDVTTPLLTRYMTAFTAALREWLNPAALYVADVHGSLAHRNAVQEGLRRSGAPRWAFRWLHDPLVEFGFQRGDAHAGGVETALVAHIDPQLVCAEWWPARVETLAAGQMTMADAVELSGDVSRFVARVEAGGPNGIVGDVRQAALLDAPELFRRMLVTARQDVTALLRPRDASLD